MTTAPIPEKSRLESLQALRAIAAWMVAIFHGIRLTSHASEPAVVAHLQAGVDVFFVLSGFVVTRSALTVSGARVFLSRRIWRIYPLYWVCSIALIAVLAWKDHSWPEPSRIVSSLALFPAAQWPILSVGWSLVHEMFFYLVLAVFIAFGRGQLARFLAVWFAAALAGGLLLRAFGGLDVPALALAFHPLNFEFLAGAAIALVHSRTNPPVPSAKASVWLASGLLAVVAFLPELPMNGYVRPLAYGLPALLVLNACIMGERRHSWSAPAWLCRLGDASYGFYLMHVPALIGLRIIADRFAPGLPAIAVVIPALVAAQLVAVLVWHRFERPLLRWFASSGSKTPRDHAGRGLA